MVKPSYNPTKMQFTQVGGMLNGKNVIYPFRLQVAKLREIEVEIRRLIDTPVVGRRLGDDFEQRCTRGKKEYWVLKTESRFTYLKKSVRALNEILDGQTWCREIDIQFGLYSHALLSCMNQPKFNDLFKVSEGGLYKREVAEKQHDTFNLLLEELMAECKSPVFVRKVKAEKTEVSKRRSSLQTWFRAVIRSASKVFWIQIQLGYESSKLVSDAAATIQHRDEFLKCRRSATQFKHMLGYVCKLNYLPTRGYVHDLVVLYDADYVFESESLVIALGELWRTVTGECGVAFIQGGPLEVGVVSLNSLVSPTSAEDKKK